MKDKIHIYYFNKDGVSIKQKTIKTNLLRLIFCLFLISLVFIGYFTFEYVNLKENITYYQNLDEKIALQLDEIIEQQRQIHTFAEELNSLKQRLSELNEYEKKIELIAKVDKKVYTEEILGVGGSSSDEVEPFLLANAKQNSILHEMYKQSAELDYESKKQHKMLDVIVKFLEDQKTLLSIIPSISPTEGWMSSKFGRRESPFINEKQEFHRGVDISTPKGTDVIATANGVVKFVGKNGNFGKMIIIDHGYGITTKYAHLNDIIIKKDDTIKRGDIIGHVGNTGKSTGPHLHYEVHMYGIPVNPQKYIYN
ncbi:MAG: peptidoglycan DD-metalloendopeptidase family protein [Desulfobacterales bacterium]|nr:peptidoglycan DD-metalloendopeptidase family protein [Desulfobacterales bacterium]